MNPNDLYKVDSWAGIGRSLTRQVEELNRAVASTDDQFRRLVVRLKAEEVPPGGEEER